MLTQLFKIMWRRKGKNFLLLAEIFFSFLVMFATATLILEGVSNYLTPLGFDYDDVYELHINQQGESNTDLSAKLKQLELVIKNSPEISQFSFSSANTPLSFNQETHTLMAEDNSESSNWYTVSLDYMETLDMALVEGRWLQDGDNNARPAVVINETLRNKLFDGESAIGKVLKTSDSEFQIVGVVKYFRSDGELSSPANAAFRLLSDEAIFPDKILIEIKQGVIPGWQQAFMDKLQPVAGDWAIDLTPLTDMKANQEKMKLVPLIILSVICGFLIFNVALGLFGVLWHNINKRYAEIGIRRAFGATEKGIRGQILGEVMVLATLGVGLGIVLALQFPLLGVMNVETYIYGLAIIVALFTIYLLVIACAWFPSKQAAQIEPAMALHYE